MIKPALVKAGVGHSPLMIFSRTSLGLGGGQGRSPLRTVSETSWLATIGLLLPVWVWLRSRTALLGPREDALVIALVAGVVGRFILFPLPDTRIHGAYLTPLAMLLLPAALVWLRGLKTVSKPG